MASTATFVDRYGLPVSTGSARAVDLYVDGIDRVLGGNAGAGDRLERAIAEDEGFALAHVALAREYQYRGRVAEARAAAARARELVAGATRREQSHVAAMATSIEGDNPGAVRLIKEHLREFPRDAFLVSQVTGPFSLIGFGGGPDWRRECFALLTPLAPAYGDDWWFLSAYAFVHNELELFDEARRLAERSLARNPRSGHGAHTVAHVYFETGDDRGGSAFLDGWMPGYAREGQLYGHLTWHHALFELAAGHYARVLDLYDRVLRPAASLGTAIITLCDASALLWRCDLYGAVATGNRWQEVHDFALQAFPRAGVTFADVHAALTYAATGDAAALARLIEGLRDRLAQGKLPAGEVAVRLAEGIAAFREGDFETTIERIEPFADQIVRVGGSNAQREVFEDTLLEAYLRTARYDRAEALLRRRLNRRHTPRDAFRLGRVEAALGRPAQARDLLARAREGWATADAGSPEVAALAQALAVLGT
jgi:tetratricopeptide (TPR) repeat protein